MTFLFFKPFRHVSAHDSLGESFDDGGCSDAGLADQDRIVLGSSRKDLDHAPNLVVPTDDRVELSLARELGQIAAVLLERLVGGLRVLAGHTLTAPNDP